MYVNIHHVYQENLLHDSYKLMVIKKITEHTVEVKVRAWSLLRNRTSKNQYSIHHVTEADYKRSPSLLPVIQYYPYSVWCHPHSEFKASAHQFGDFSSQLLHDLDIDNIYLWWQIKKYGNLHKAIYVHIKNLNSCHRQH